MPAVIVVIKLLNAVMDLIMTVTGKLTMVIYVPMDTVVLTENVVNAVQVMNALPAVSAVIENICYVYLLVLELSVLGVMYVMKLIQSVLTCARGSSALTLVTDAGRVNVYQIPV